MKILMLIASLDVGGAETHLFELCRALALLGNDVTVASSGGRLCESLERAGVKCTRLRLDTRKPHILLFSYYKACRLLKKGDFDIIHAHSRIAALVGEAAARKAGKCFVTTAHAHFKCNAILKRLTRWGHSTIAVSEDLAHYLCENYSIPSSRIRIIENGIDTDRFKPTSEEKSGIVFVSRLDADSSAAAYALCRIAVRLAKRHKGITIRIYGGGSEYTKLCEAAKKVNSELGYNCVLLLGGGRDISLEIANARAFVGVSRCALEAMACGIPTVLAGNEGAFGIVDQSNIEDAAKSNFCGRGSAHIDDGRLYENISALLALDDDERKALSEFLCGYVTEHNGALKMARETLGFYRNALASISLAKCGVCLCGYYGYGNVGDDTLLELAISRGKKNGAVMALTHSPKRAELRFGVPCFNRLNPFSVLRALSCSHTLVFGGGTLFQDRTSLRSMLYYLLTAEVALLFGKKVELWGNGICEPRYRLSRAWLAHIISRSEYIGLRDKPSLLLAYSLGADKRKTVLEGDLALSLCKEQCKESFRTRKIAQGLERYSLFALSKRSTAEEYQRAKEQAKGAKADGIMPIVVAMYPLEDRDICRAFAKEVNGRYAEGLTAGELVALLERSEHCLSARLHLLVFAKIAGTPFEALGTDPKLTAFCKENE